MRNNSRSITELETFLSNPLTFSTFHTWSTPDSGDRTADLYFSTAGASLSGWTKSSFREYFRNASVEEQLVIHDILNLEDRSSGVESGGFRVSSEQVGKIQKWFNSAEEAGGSFGKVVLQLKDEEVETLLRRAGELGGVSGDRGKKKGKKRARKLGKVFEGHEDKVGLDMSVGKVKKATAKRKKRGHCFAAGEDGKCDTLGIDVSSDYREAALTQHISTTKVDCTVDEADESLQSIAVGKSNDKTTDLKLCHDEDEVGKSEIPASIVKVETTKSKRKSARYADECDAEEGRNKRRRGNIAVKDFSKQMESLDNGELSDHKDNEGLQPVHPEAPHQDISIGPEADGTGSPTDITTKEESPTTSKLSTPSQDPQKPNIAPLTPTSNTSPPRTPRRIARSQTTTTTTPCTPPKRTPTTSPYFPTPTSTPPKRPAAGTTSSIPFPPLTSPFFGLAQEPLAHNPFHLLLAVQFLNKTKGSTSMPVFRSLIADFPTPESLASTNPADLVPRIRHLGLQNQRAAKCVALAKTWVEHPPERGKRYRTLHYPYVGAGKEVGPAEVVADESVDPRGGAWEVAHLPGVGDYAIDSWRIFCRDVLRGVAGGWLGEGGGGGGGRVGGNAADRVDGNAAHKVNGNAAQEALNGVKDIFEPEWKRVLPHDKELRAYLRWLWLKEGWVWDPLTGHRVPAPVSDGVEIGGMSSGGVGGGGGDAGAGIEMMAAAVGEGVVVEGLKD